MSDSTTTNPYASLNNAMTTVDPEIVSKTNQKATTGKGANLDKDAFLKLLVAQMRYQDPLEPMDNSQMVAQMAQFTTLEQLMTMSSTMSSYFNYQMANSVIQYSALIGQEVSYEMPIVNKDGSISDQKDKGTSTVTGVKFEDGSVILTLANGKDVDSGYVASIGKVSASKDEVTTDKKDESATEKGEDTANGSSTTETASAGTI